ncbi:MAG: hypothetical protein JKY08_03355 [Flavobacteriaceae bacterium]|nr:hypothetical protein [Flavobacteriaceae bacterium]
MKPLIETNKKCIGVSIENKALFKDDLFLLEHINTVELGFNYVNAAHKKVYYTI